MGCGTNTVIVKMMVSPKASRPDKWREHRTQNRQCQGLFGSPNPWGTKVRISDMKTKLGRRLYDSCPTWRRMSPRSWPSPPQACPGRRRCSPEAPTTPSPLSPHVYLHQFSFSKYFSLHFVPNLFVGTTFLSDIIFQCIFCYQMFVCTRIVWEISVNSCCTLAQTSIQTHNSRLYVFDDKMKKMPFLPYSSFNESLHVCVVT